MEDQGTQPHYAAPPRNDVPLYSAPRKESNRTVVVLLCTVLGLTALIAVGAVVLVMSQSRVTTHITKSSSNSSSTNKTTTTGNGSDPQTKVVVVPQSTSSPAPAATPAPASDPESDSGSAGEGALTNQYGNIEATSNVSSGLANNIFYEYWEAAGDSGSSETVNAWSSQDQQYYTADCVPGADTVMIACSIQGPDPDTMVQFPMSAVDAYDQAQASNYAANHDTGPNG